MRNFFILCGIVVSMCGCRSLSDPLAMEYGGYGIKPFTATSLATTKELLPAVAAEAGADPALYKECNGLAYPATSADKHPTPAQCQALRNAMVAVVMLSSEEACVAHRRSIYGKEATFNIAAGTFTSFFSGWAAVAPGAHTKAVLAALALFANSERSLVNEMVYKSTIVPAVDKKIAALREEYALNIATHFQDNVDTYPLPIAMRDAIYFHYSCSFMVGLEKVVEEGTQEPARQKLARLNRTLDPLMKKLQTIPVANRDADPSYQGLKDRTDSLIKEITILEKQ